MALDRNAYIENYIDELNENLKHLGSSALKLKKDPENEAELKQILRLLHSIKGASRMLDFHVMEKISHGLEDVFKGISDQRYVVKNDIIELVFVCIDYLSAAAEMIKEEDSDLLPVELLMDTLNRASSNEPFDTASVRYNVIIGEESSEGHGLKGALPDENESVRIKVATINKILKKLNGLIIRQFHFKKENEQLHQLENLIREMQNYSGRNYQKEKFQQSVDSAIKTVAKIRKDFHQELPQLEREAFDVQAEVLQLRMLPFSLISDSMPRMVDEIATKLGKDVDFEIEGDGILLDKVILEKVKDPVVHLLRNSLDHGIEQPEERKALSKIERARLKLSCQKEGGNIVIKICDDGKGIDYEKVRSRAIELNPAREKEISEMEESSLNIFLFESGFSVKEEADDLSGRGVGLDIVKVNVEQIKGKISLNSTRGMGTEFAMTLPASLSTVEGFFIKSSGEKLLIPSNFVKEVIIIDKSDIIDLISKKAFKLRNEIITFYNLAAILDVKGKESSGEHFMIIVEAFGETIGVAVDSVLRFSSLVHKPLPSNLQALSAVRGVVFDENFDIIPILHVPELINRFKRLKNIDLRKKYSEDEKEYKRILIVDDSSTTREIIKSIVEAADYKAQIAVDGIDALDKLDERYYHLIITDQQMPRMDGLTLVSNLRKKDKYSKTPIILLSSITDDDTHNDFKNLDVEAMLVKSEFQRETLLNEINKLIG